MGARTIVLSLAAICCAFGYGAKARAGQITAVDSTFSITAAAQAGTSPLVTGMDSQAQGSTINPLVVTASALATDPSNQSVLATGAGSATWIDASFGLVTFTNVGWTSVNASGSADLSRAAGWNYSFISNVTGSFVVDYKVTAQGTSSDNPPLFGLNGFSIYRGQGQSSQGSLFDTTGTNAIGTVTMAIAPGGSYWVRIQDSANIFGGLGTSSALMTGAFVFSVQTDSGGTGAIAGLRSVPEPSSWVTMMIGLGLAGTATARRRLRSAQDSPGL
jgi:hypothetical protein